MGGGQTCGWHRRKLSRICWLLCINLILYCGDIADGDTVTDVVIKQNNLRLLGLALNITGLSATLNDTSKQFTLFAPSDSAYASAMFYKSLSCTIDYYDSSICTTSSQYIASTDLPSALSNFVAICTTILNFCAVVNGTYATSNFTNSTVLSFAGTAVRQVSISSSGQIWLGGSPIVQANLSASNGVVHILGSVPSSISVMNESSVTVASNLGNFGPFTLVKRQQMVAMASGAMPTDLSTLIGSYQSNRVFLDLPQGGLANPMAISYDPSDMYRLLRAVPSGGYVDTESVNGSSPVSQTSSLPSTPSINIGSKQNSSQAALPPLQALVNQTEAPLPSQGNLQRISTQSSVVYAPTVHGIGEAGVLGGSSASASLGDAWAYEIPQSVTRPASNDSLAFLTLAELMRTGQVTSVELVEIFTARMQRYDYVLEAVVTYTTDLALKQAAAADTLLSQGTYLGPLHGIPYGLKDIIAVSGYPTTWGAPEFRNQYINENANVYLRLRAAGAVLIAKLATGEMAYDDVWWGGFVKNPWNIAEGSSGSSAGPTASTVAGTVPFSVGTETEGSLMSPAATCGATAMRPSLGSIGRSYVMTLADSLDKMGPICRSVADCAVIFDVLRGQDDLDPTSRVSSLSDPFDVDISQMVVGYLPGMDIQAREVLQVLAQQGVQLKPFSLNYSVKAEEAIMTIMISEAAAHFDYWQRSGQDNLNRRQDYWPPLLRLARLIPAVEYIQAQRIRSLLAVEVMGSMRDAGIDAFIANSTTELAMSNLVGIPTVSVPTGYVLASGASGNSTRRNPLTVGFFGWPNGEPEILALGMAWQNATTYHLQQPPIDRVEASILNECLPYSKCSLPVSDLAPAPSPAISISTGAASSVADSG